MDDSPSPGEHVRRTCGCGSQVNSWGKPQASAFLSKYQGNPFWTHPCRNPHILVVMLGYVFCFFYHSCLLFMLHPCYLSPAPSRSSLSSGAPTPRAKAEPEACLREAGLGWVGLFWFEGSPGFVGVGFRGKPTGWLTGKPRGHCSCRLFSVCWGWFMGKPTGWLNQQDNFHVVSFCWGWFTGKPTGNPTCCVFVLRWKTLL